VQDAETADSAFRINRAADDGWRKDEPDASFTPSLDFVSIFVELEGKRA
jgi:hypothetical protein